MINGAHFIIYSTDAKADVAFFRDILKLTNVDAGNGWLIFGLPPAELAVHPSSANDKNEMYLLCDDLEAFNRQMKEHHIHCSAIQDQRWGRVTHITLPGGGQLGVYEPRHARPETTKNKSGKNKRISLTKRSRTRVKKD
jgi:hypothetical protein